MRDSFLRRTAVLFPRQIDMKMGPGETKESVGFVSANASFGDWKLFRRDRFKWRCRVRPRTNFASPCR